MCLHKSYFRANKISLSLTKRSCSYRISSCEICDILVMSNVGLFCEIEMKIARSKVKNIFQKNGDEFSTHRRTTLYIPVLVVEYSLILQCFCHRHVETVVGCRCLVFEGIVYCFLEECFGTSLCNAVWRSR